ncbi:D-tyrosyl-tRNA(Tyr) deacylase [Candidatus Woesebacteria bacterium RIFCSPHIGHO2_01_FULL_39_17]|uniref:D-aminoacyl-tRNA deacylase n=3 Tax=Candidatus Woeseibacteriota TaxID=1752722 RepID=A0A0G0NDW1_9BACT|nr:MAG: D-tyrosyl-tRNA(Tyr) deacylase, D-tyrosyl-tRNA(Tyr) deacylase [Microgenomates group bacterium GW2011_GWC1_38_12]KKQ93771.1 MAG: D-tyrosyl-tRNA(Tyr) deacylase [Candidatus Woesebacteria bacterium GW2011_GWB1_39_10b]KKR14334.1 MAG: D-tyrosyl-tRNA(Tyr) deacylase [Candidatus Woesebacteria bacterium GW2011_GWA1_39_21b]OGM23609.1 MAG: D-tyrosyl-tRNA(Tyr) deacylase [Candidatus Woesebacteria bacterium RIFCSPHIGHO2_01_FULL_39_17]OGM64345.1 MAG: D-tyrosyl-tRNA(Tyr) deacylase [Candidatus Woesebacter
MKLVVQRVTQAQVKVKKKVVGKINLGLFVLVGVGKEDSEEDARVFAEKLAKMRIMADENGKMNLSVDEVKGKVLAVSQFTLYADTSGGNRPSFIKAAEPRYAEKIYDYFVERLKALGVKVETGKFGEYMEIEAKLDGPVTIII